MTQQPDRTTLQPENANPENANPEKHGSLFGGALTDEVLDSSRKVLTKNRGRGALVGTQQFFTPLSASQLIAGVFGRPQAVLDPTAGSGALLAPYPMEARYGIEIDRDHTRPRDNGSGANGAKTSPYNAITADAQAVVPMLRAAGMRFPALAINPPFGLTWRDPVHGRGEINSTTLAFLWAMDLLDHSGQAAMICGRDRFRKEILGRKEAAGVYAIVDVEGPLFRDVDLPTSIVFFVRPENRGTFGRVSYGPENPPLASPSPPAEFSAKREDLPDLALPIVDHRSRQTRHVSNLTHMGSGELSSSFTAIGIERERRDRDARAKRAANRYDFTIKGRKVGVGLSAYARITLAKENTLREMEKLANQHVSYFAQNKRSWKKITELRDKGLITVDPGLEDRVASVLKDAEKIGTPLFPVRKQMRLGWLTDLDRIPCKKDDPERNFEAGKEYKLSTHSKVVSQFEERLVERKDGTQEPRKFEKQRKLLAIDISDSNSPTVRHVFNESNENIEYLIEHFEIPDPGCVATRFPETVNDRRHLLKHIAKKNGFQWRLFQLDHMSRLLVKERGMLAHEQGLGKTLMLMGLTEATIRLGAEDRALYVVPQDLIRQWQRESQKFFGNRIQIISNPQEAKDIERRIAAGETGRWISYYEALSTVGRKRELLPHVPLFSHMHLERRLEQYKYKKNEGIPRNPVVVRPLPDYDEVPQNLFSFGNLPSPEGKASATKSAFGKGAAARNGKREDASEPAVPDDPYRDYDLIGDKDETQDEPYADVDVQFATTLVACPKCGATTYEGWDGEACNAEKRCVTHGPFKKVKSCPEDGAGCVIKGCNYTHRSRYAKSSYTHLTRAFKGGVLAIDEVSEIRGDDSLRSKSIRAISSGPHVYGATGTPLSNFIADSYWGLLVTLGASSPAFPYSHVGGEAKFEDDFCVQEFMKGREEDGEENQNKRKRLLPEITNVSQFWRLAQPGVSRCRKEQTGEPLVPRTYLPIEVPMGVEQRKSHYFWLANFSSYFSWRHPNHPLVRGGLVDKWAAALGQLWHLERAATLPASEEAVHEWPVAQAQIGSVSNWTPANLKVLELAMEHAAKGEKILIGSDLIMTGKWIADRLREKGIRAVHITEETGTGENRKVTTKNPRKRSREVEAFVEGDAQVLCAGVNAMKLGHNLDVASTVIAHGLPYSFMSLAQFIARVHRLTSKNPVSVYVILPKNSLAERKWNLLKDKGSVSDLAYDGELQVQPEKPIDWNKVLKEMRGSGIRATGNEVHEEDIEAQWNAIPTVSYMPATRIGTAAGNSKRDRNAGTPGEGLTGTAALAPTGTSDESYVEVSLF